MVKESRSKVAVEILHRAELSDSAKIKKRIDGYQARFANPLVAASAAISPR
jgi:propionyl-CoA carboxylase beta subunit